MNPLSSMTSDLERQVATYLAALEDQYNKLRAPAEQFLESIRAGEPMRSPEEHPPKRANSAAVTPDPPADLRLGPVFQTKTNVELVEDALEDVQAGELVTIKDIEKLVEARFGDQLTERQISTSWRKVLLRRDSPFELFKENPGNVPNVYRKIRPEEPISVTNT